jgi:hypothetical protein
MRTGIALLASALAVAIAPPPAAAQQTSVLTYHDNASRSGNYVVPALTWEKARSLRLDRSFDARVAGHLYAQPLYWRAPGSNGAMLVVATEDDVVQAFDAATGSQLWRRSVGRPVPASSLPCGNIDPVGITGTPVIDPSRGAVYFDAEVDSASGPRHDVFGLSLKDGAVLPGWPIDVSKALQQTALQQTALQQTGRRFDARTQNQRAALTLLDGRLYVAFGGRFGDCGDYHGWVVGLSLHDPGNDVVSFETRARGGGIWAPGGLSVVGRDIFFATGNTFGAQTWSDGEAVFRLPPDLHRSTGKKDYFAPANWKALDDRDEDLGGSNPIPLDLSAAGRKRALMLALGKDRKAYLLDRNDLGGIGGALASATVSNLRILTSAAAYPSAGGMMVAFQGPGARCPNPTRGDGLTVLRIEDGSPPTIKTAWCAVLDGRGSAIVTTTDGRSDPIVWVLGAEGDDRLHGFKGDNGEPIFASQPMRGLRHFETLIATANRLYVGADGRIYAFDF